MKKDLDILRKEIDRLDEELLAVLSKRIEIVRSIGKFKKIQGENPLDIKRWDEVLSSRISKSKLLNIPTSLVNKIFNLIHEHALEIERNS